MYVGYGTPSPYESQHKKAPLHEQLTQEPDTRPRNEYQQRYFDLAFAPNLGVGDRLTNEPSGGLMAEPPMRGMGQPQQPPMAPAQPPPTAGTSIPVAPAVKGGNPFAAKAKSLGFSDFQGAQANALRGDGNG